MTLIFRLVAPTLPRNSCADGTANDIGKSPLELSRHSSTGQSTSFSLEDTGSNPGGGFMTPRRSVYIFGSNPALTKPMLEALSKIVSQEFLVLCGPEQRSVLNVLFDANYPHVRVYYSGKLRSAVKDACDLKRWEMYDVAGAKQHDAMIADCHYALCLGNGPAWVGSKYCRTI